MNKISLCCITGNEAPAIEGFLASFREVFDELCLVRAVGVLEHDRTLTLAKDWCRKNNKGFNAGEFKNPPDPSATWAYQSLYDELGSPDPATWPHVSHFAAARNQAWSMASNPWQIWADLDDVLVEPPAGERGGSELIRYWAERGEHDQVFFKYDLRTQSESCMRERLFRTGTAKWKNPLHEQCHPAGGNGRVLHENRVIYSHAPQGTKQRDPKRNRRIMQYHMQHVNAYPFELHREYFYEACASGRVEDAESATRWAEIAQKTNLPDEQRYQMMIHQAALAARFRNDTELAIELCDSAIAIKPNDRAAWGEKAKYQYGAKKYKAMLVSTSFMQSVPKAREDGFPRSEHYHGWQGAHLRILALRVNELEDKAAEMEESIFQASGKRISLLHATRGRPKQALEARMKWFSAAFVPLGVEHIFAIDADDQESLDALKHYRHIIVENPNGCVKAWNAAAAASSGQVLIQLSDDWTPCHDWDAMVWEALESSARDRIEKSGGFYDNALGLVPLVLAVHDGHRNDALLCMAILTRARYEQQTEAFVGRGDILHTGPWLFSPEYFGVFSDNEFTHRSYDDGVVVQAQHIVFNHNHPVFGTAKMDATYVRQNAPERYAEGLEVFCRRNPKHAAQYKQTA